MRAAVLVLLALLLSACEFSLAGDLIPPPGAELTGATPTPQPIEYPAQIPDPINGAQIYIESCAPCHGASGLGDGAMAGELPFAPAPIGDPDLVYASAPLDWYRMITNGNLDRFMPPFAEALSLQQRWDALAYALSLSWDQDLLGPGELLYLEAEQSLPAADVQSLADQSLLDLATSLEGYSEQEALALATYLQSEAFGLNTATAAAPTPAADAETEADAGSAQSGVASGQVVNGTSGEAVGGLPVLLHAYQHTTEMFTLESELAADGSFQFDDVELRDDYVYFAAVDYAGLTYFSEFVSPSDGSLDFVTPISVYETTADPENIVAERLHFVVEFPSQGRVRLVQLVLLSNFGDRALAPADDGTPSLHYNLPAEASNLVFEQGEVGERYIPEAAGFGDIRAVLPGEGTYQVLFAYELPYSRGLDFELPVEWPVDAVIVFLPEGDITLNGESFVDAGAQTLDAAVYNAYTAGAVPGGDSIKFELSGPHPLGGSSLLALANSDQVLIGMIALTAAVGLAYLYLRRYGETPGRSVQLLDEILALDERYAAGEVSEAVYAKRRAALKARLAAALDQEKGA
jgi:mono/diheme cytochrome c family protein